MPLPSYGAPVHGATWNDLQTAPPRVALQQIRALRWSPPGRGGSGRRKETFGAALEQAEQLMRAAGAASVQSRPILVFYALSQAGRAVAAVARGADYGDWELSGHGLKDTGASGAATSGLDGIALKDVSGRAAAFPRLADLLECGALPEPVGLADLWALLPDTTRCPLPGLGALTPLSVTADPGWQLPGIVASLQVGPLPDGLAAPPVEGEGPGEVGLRDWDGERDAAAAFLGRYPELGGYVYATPAAAPVGLQGDGQGGATVRLHWPAGTGPATVGYRGSDYAFPALTAGGKAQHPFLIWWAVTFALSKLARYHPGVWGRVVDVQASADAVAVEHLLEQSLTVVPELVHRTVEEAAADR